MHICITAVEDSVLYVRGWRNYSGGNMNINTPGRVTVSSSSSWRIRGIIISASTDVSVAVHLFGITRQAASAVRLLFTIADAVSWSDCRYSDCCSRRRSTSDRLRYHVGWRCGVVVSGVRRMNEVNARRARLVPGWVTVCGRVYHLIGLCNKPTRSTQPCIPPGSLNRVPASAGVRAGMSLLPVGR